ncbi:uncharacterized protein K489DRAFT_139818 [Dissoconium aciculare CBS 342.82]|uniref:Uncharacterized protein n=1 Tax=Dissoconium aciculare CBS 342.82 TaxID=1314786 RepID=A0A6J3LPL8_9PEZI|nr:uncharacterized protein K489DRAFT_139818 [Dissoconium aciculare CBS 342.82]KAF1817820.1 hypothetical protein K489DRAFT_139818 [Dissoconium aciculare CBS 342.82]
MKMCMGMSTHLYRTTCHAAFVVPQLSVAQSWLSQPLSLLSRLTNVALLTRSVAPFKTRNRPAAQTVLSDDAEITNYQTTQLSASAFQSSQEPMFGSPYHGGYSAHFTALSLIRAILWHVVYIITTLHSLSSFVDWRGRTTSFVNRGESFWKTEMEIAMELTIHTSILTILAVLRWLLRDMDLVLMLLFAQILSTAVLASLASTSEKQPALSATTGEEAPPRGEKCAYSIV